MALDNRYMDGSYLEETGNWHSEDAHWKAQHILRGMQALGTSVKTVGDIGCGSGDVLAYLAKNLPDIDAFAGWELAPAAFDLTLRHASPKLSFFNQSLFEAPGQVYDLILAMDVFEHVEDYIGFLKKLRAHGKAFMFHIPLDASAYSVFFEENILRYKREKVGHLHYYTKYTALATLEDSGYSIVNHFFTHSKVETPAKGAKEKVKQAVRKAVFGVNPDLCSRTIGGCSLMVTATAQK